MPLIFFWEYSEYIEEYDDDNNNVEAEHYSVHMTIAPQSLVLLYY